MFVKRNYVYETGSMTRILGQLKWKFLKKRRKDNILILLYNGLKGKARLPTDDLIPKIRRCRNQHSIAFQIPSVFLGLSGTGMTSPIPSAEMSHDCLSKFTSFVRARDYFPSHRPWCCRFT